MRSPLPPHLISLSSAFHSEPVTRAVTYYPPQDCSMFGVTTLS